jgi:dipeptidase E
VASRPRQIVAMGGGGFQMEPDNRLLDDQVLALARASSGHDRPRICLIPTASADDEVLIADFERLFAPRSEPRVLRLFARTEANLRELVLGQDAVYITGGNTANLFALWRLHGLDIVLREAWNAGVVMAGMSAGAICWFEACTTDSFGPELQPLRGGLGILDGSLSPHYHGEAQRRPLFRRLVADGTLPPGYGVDDGAALVFRDRELIEVVTSDRDAAAFRVDPNGTDGSIETRLPTRYLG